MQLYVHRHTLLDSEKKEVVRWRVYVPRKPDEEDLRSLRSPPGLVRFSGCGALFTLSHGKLDSFTDDEDRRIIKMGAAFNPDAA